MRHDNVLEVVRRVMRRAGIASTEEPFLAPLQRNDASSVAHLPARGDVLLVLDGKLCVGNVSVIHPSAPTNGVVAATHPDAAKRAQYAQHGPADYRFSPLSVEIFG
jgi:hypothetical protein